MPNAKRVRQDQEAAQKRYARYGEQITAYNANVDQVNAANQSASDLYNQQAAAYNAWMEQIKAGQSTGLAKTDDGRYAQLGSHEGNYAYSYRDKKGNPTDAGALVDPAGIPTDFAGRPMGESLWVRNPDGTATRYVSQYTKTGSWQDISGQQVEMPIGDGAPAFLPTDRTLKIAEFNTPAPTPQQVSVPTPEEPKGWNPSRRELEELKQPTANAAQAQMATARGETAKVGLMNEAVGNQSVFADPEDPNNLADKGILARVLGGQL